MWYFYNIRFTCGLNSSSSPLKYQGNMASTNTSGHQSFILKRKFASSDILRQACLTMAWAVFYQCNLDKKCSDHKMYGKIQQQKICAFKILCKINSRIVIFIKKVQFIHK